MRASSRAISIFYTRQACSRLYRNQPPSAPQWLHRSSFTPRGLATAVAAADLRFGQPLHETHPHLLGPGEVTPGITALEYDRRRSNLASKLPNGAVAIVAASEIKFRSGAVFYEFHQDPDFFYLTGFNEPGALAVIERKGPDGHYSFHLFVRPKDSHAELWDGARSGVQAALDVFNADEAADIARAPRILTDLLSGDGEVFTDAEPVSRPTSFWNRIFSEQSKGEQRLSKLWETKTVKPLRPLLNDLRVFKSDAEIANMRRAGQASGRAITEAMRQVPGTEKGLAAFLDYRFKMEGCDTSAYVPVVAAGRNALSIHYVRNDDMMHDGQLVLVDAGGEYGGYITDITRTWPVNGKFSPAQKDLYEAILKVQRSCVSLCRQDAAISLDGLHQAAEGGLKEQLRQLGFDMSGDALTTLFPHHVGHYIGLDVHDSPGYSRKASLKARQCVTIEPGIYVPDDERWPKQFRGLGIRIEDSVCVQESHPLVFTTEAVKELVDIESVASR